MSRKHANIRNDIWNDEDFRSLSSEAQLLYLQFLTSGTLTYAGVADWRPKRIALLSQGRTPKQVESAAQELIDGLFIIVDEDSEEALIRSFLRHDGLLMKPNVAKAMVSAYGKIHSLKLKAVLVHQLTGLKERFPEWRAFTAGVVDELLRNPSLNPSEMATETLAERDASLLTTNYLLPTTNYLTTNDESEVAIAAPRPDVDEILDFLDLKIVENGSKKPARSKKNMDAARLVMDSDGRTFAEVESMIRWCQADEFWRSNILSMSKLREKFDQMKLQQDRKPAGQQSQRLSNAELAMKKMAERRVQHELT